MRWAAVVGLSLACAPVPRAGSNGADVWSDEGLLAEGARFLDDTRYRRTALERSLTNPANTYSRLRLISYGLGTRGWDLLPEWTPRSKPIDGPGPLVPVWDGVRPQTMEGWVALGRRVFFGYPMRADFFVEYGLAHSALGDAAGLTRDGQVLFENVDGAERVGITCATCHSVAGVAGVARRTLDYGRLRVSVFDDGEVPLDPAERARQLGWGPGRADVTEDDDEDPVAIPDLWGLRSQRWLTAAGTIRHESPLALAIRQDTQLTDSNHARVRPPRALAWALTLFLYSLQPPAPQPTERGADVFARECRGCHSNAVWGGRPIAARDIGTDPALAHGRGRGTGHYRTPALIDVRHGAPYLHDGSVGSLEELLNPDRESPGHRAGTELSPDDRAALLAFLRGL